ncbi:MAG: TatD family hydrolase [Rhodopirellula sp. JB044]|uniref:TatD family hydrolase n=1 Tax=Rhodopirellula sp. JB044 TaxID=3342844 RepID=UPI00370CB155
MVLLNLFDTHAHLNTDTFDSSVDEVIARAKEAGVGGIAVIGIDVETSRRACELAKSYPGYLHAVVGIQPNSAAEAAENDFEVIQELAEQPGVVGIGETGLDCYWDDTPIEMQHEFFQQHLDFAVERSLPVVIHMRESCSLIIDQLRSQSSLPPTVMHSFTGNLDEARACLDLGCMISFAGMVTFKKSMDLREVAAMVPEDRLLVETDSPYLSPEPLRGRRPNEPARVEHTLRCLAEVRKVSPESLAETTTANARRFFRI